MTPEAQRIAIAEACGWTAIELLPAQRDPFTNEDNYLGSQPKLMGRNQKFEFRPLPDYLNDLNAMHEAEKIFVHACEANKGKPTTYDYWRCLWDMRGRSNIGVTFSTAAQRAEAFLRTLGKWE